MFSPLTHEPRDTNATDSRQKHSGLKHTLQRLRFPFPLTFLFSSICKTIRSSCNAPKTWADEKKWRIFHRHYPACDRNLSAIIWVIRTYNSYLFTSNTDFGLCTRSRKKKCLLTSCYLHNWSHKLKISTAWQSLKFWSEFIIEGQTWRRSARVIRDRAISVIVEVSLMVACKGCRRGVEGGRWCDVRIKVNMCAPMRKYG